LSTANPPRGIALGEKKRSRTKTAIKIGKSEWLRRTSKKSGQDIANSRRRKRDYSPPFWKLKIKSIKTAP